MPTTLELPGWFANTKAGKEVQAEARQKQLVERQQAATRLAALEKEELAELPKRVATLEKATDKVETLAAELHAA